MKTSKTLGALALATLLGTAAGCTNMSPEGQGATSGALIGGAAGAGIAAIAGGNAAIGLGVGAVSGGVAGHIKGRKESGNL